MWLYKGQEIRSLEDIENNDQIIGFVYKITEQNASGMITGTYIGKKSLFSSRKTKIGVKEKSETKTRKTFKRVVKESDWMKYWGSSKPLLDQIRKRGEKHFTREILEFCCSKKFLSFCEIEHQIKNNVLRDPNSYNGNILSRYFEKDMINCDFEIKP